MTAPSPPGHLAWAIAIPARNDADRIAACLAALARQRDVAMADGAVVVFASNCNDDTPRIARESKQACVLHVVQQNSAPSEGGGGGSTGEARRLAMAHARRLLRKDGVLLTTDANVTVDSDWVAAMIASFADRRIDAVAGAVSPYSDELALEPSIGALERQYWDLIVATEDAIDPQPYDPAPRHGRESGSNFGIRASMFDAVGGVPVMARGEIRALADAVRARDGGIRHAAAPHATATAPPHHSLVDESMASAPRDPIKSRIWWPAATVERRLTLRRTARIAYARGEFAAWAADHGARDTPAQAYFGSSWAGYVARSPGLAPTPVDRAALPAQIAMLEYLLAQDVSRD